MGLFDLCRHSIRCLRRYVGRLAPPGSRRRNALAGAYYLLGLSWLNHLPPRPRRVPPLPDLYDRNGLNNFLSPFGIHFPDRLRGPVTPDNASRRVLELLLIDAELRRRFPQALGERSDGDFARWLFSGEAECLGVSGEAARLMVDALGSRPGLALQHFYYHHLHALKQFPLGLTPADRPVFLYWLVQYHKELGVKVDEVLWFIFESAEDPAYGLGETFRQVPAWQQAVPHGLTRFGWDQLKSWVVSHYRIRGNVLENAQRPDWLRPAEELHLLTLARPELLQLHPNALADAQAARALVRRHIGKAGGDPSWSDADYTEPKRGVNLMGHLRYPSGLQVAALNSAAALESAGYFVSRRDVPNNVDTDLPGRDGFLGLHPFPITLVHLAPEPLAENSYPHSGLAIRKNTYRIGYWYWEMEQVPRRWNRHASWIHELWAPTRFIGQALRSAMKIPVIDMLAGMRMPPAVNLPRARFGLPNDHFLFLFVFDMGSTMERKNPLGAIEAFRKAFSPKDCVTLVIKVSRGWHDPAGLRALQEASSDRNIRLIDAILSPDELFGLMNTCDAYVSLHRSEGYGLTMAESMALGKPVIATGYSGNLDFMTPSNSLLVSYSKTPLKATVRLYRRGGSWAEPSVDHAAELMRWVVAHPAESRAMGQRAARDVRTTLSLETAGQRMAARLDQLTSRTVFRAAG